MASEMLEMPFASSSRYSFAPTEIQDSQDGSAASMTSLYDPTMRNRHPADRAVTPEPLEQQEGEGHSTMESPLPSFEESQRGAFHGMHSAEDDRSWESVATGPLAKLSMDAEQQRYAAGDATPSPINAAKRSFLSNLLRTRSNSGSPRTSPLVDRSRSPDAPQATFPRSQTQPYGLGLGIASADESAHPETAIPSSSSSPAALDAHSRAPASAGELAEMGLALSTLTVPLNCSKFSPPTCGCVLDSKYLLIGHALGMDFLPLDPSIAGKIRRPIPLIKRTRVRQLMILEERSNVLLAIGGRNDHIRVYALDGVRSTIEKRLREVLPLSQSLGSRIVKRGPKQPASPPARPKGKGRAEPPPPLQSMKRRVSVHGIPISPPPPYRRHSIIKGAPTSPNRTATSSHSRSGSIVTVVPTASPTSSLIYKRSSDGFQPDNGSRRPSAVALGKRRASAVAGSETNLFAMPVSRDISQSGTDATSPDEDVWTDVSRDAALHRPAEDRTERTSGETAVKESLPELQIQPPSATWPPPAEMLESPTSTRARLTPRSPKSESSAELTRAMSDLLREGPADRSPSLNRKTPVIGTPRSATSDGDNEIGRALMDFLQESESPRGSSPRSVRSARFDRGMMARSASINMQADRASTRDLAAMLRDESPPTAHAAELESRDSISVASESGVIVAPQEEDALISPAMRSDLDSSSPKQSRNRWTMLESVLRPSAGSSGAATRVQTLASSRLNTTAVEDPFRAADASILAVVDRTLTASSPKVGQPSTAGPAASPETSKGPIAPSLIPFEGSGTGESASDEHARVFARAETHPASANAPLEYVKLARTRGARFFKAVETKHKTYLAVLCGEHGERVELFTGAKNVALSLNRTFMLPESPRSIEFQLQGDELVDIYLLYNESVFALEPATVRVREVGVARNERRAARRERDRLRQARQQAGMAPLPSLVSERPDCAPSASAAGSTEMPNTPVQSPPDHATSAVTQDAEVRNAAVEASSIIASVDTTVSPTLSKPRPSAAQCFSTWQQLPFIPPVPPSVLASSFVIPPTYETVVATTPQTKQEGFPGAVPAEPVQSAEDGGAMPLLSPISLLANHPSRQSGPPGLFFVSRGRHMTNIVDGDGRSVIRKAIQWDTSTVAALEHDAHVDVFSRLELLIVDGGRKTVIVGFGPAQIQAIEIGPKRGSIHTAGEAVPAESVEVAPVEVSVKRSRTAGLNLRDVTYLGKAGEVVFWSERMGSSVAVYSLCATD